MIKVDHEFFHGDGRFSGLGTADQGFQLHNSSIGVNKEFLHIISDGGNLEVLHGFVKVQQKGIGVIE